MSEIAFHFILLAAGHALKEKNIITAVDVQNFMTRFEEFGVRPPLEDCRLALTLLEDAELIKSIGETEYIRG